MYIDVARKLTVGFTKIQKSLKFKSDLEYRPYLKIELL